MQFTARLFLTGLFCLAMDATAPEPAFAQGGGATTSLSGTVTDTSGAIIPGATVVVKSNGTATEFSTVSNESGYFTRPGTRSRRLHRHRDADGLQDRGAQ